jgi:hypothetical protein
VAEYIRLFRAAVSQLPPDGGVELKRLRWKVIFDSDGNLTENQALERERLSNEVQAGRQLHSLALGE